MTNTNTDNNLFWHDGLVSREMRYNQLGQKGITIWLSGLSGSGKSTIAVALEHELFKRGILAYRLDGDNIRLGINNNLKFSLEDRKENIRRVGEVAKLFNDAGVVVISSFISPYKEDRDLVRSLHTAANLSYMEIYVDCPLEIAEQRDPKGLYKKARAGLLKGFTGIDDPYEIPQNMELHLQTNKLELSEEINLIIEHLLNNGYIK